MVAKEEVPAVCCRISQGVGEVAAAGWVGLGQVDWLHHLRPCLADLAMRTPSVPREMAAARVNSEV